MCKVRKTVLVKKRLISAVLIIVLMIAAAIPVSADSYKRGDADGDGVVTILDATVIQRKLAEFAVSRFNETAADVNGDGLNILDATAIQRYLAGFPNTYQIGETVGDIAPTDSYELPFIPKK